MGHMSLIKGIFYLLEAWKQLDTSNAHLFLCGEMGPDVRYLFEQRYQNLPNLSYEGVVNPRKYYESCDVLVCPSLSEGMARVTLEAMFYGLPMVATRESGTIAEDKDSAFLISARDIDSLAIAMEHFIRNHHLIEVMGNRAMQVAEKFSWLRYSNGLFEILSKVTDLRDEKG
jgi:glycosyltransferase involved in cell wall biosynthesis